MVYFVSSSLSALDHIQATDNKSKRNIWLILFSLVTALAIFQTTDVVTSFFKLSMEDFESEEATTGNDVSVSVCFPMNSKRLPWLKLTTPMLDKFKKLNASCDVVMPSPLCQSVLTDRERFIIGNHIPMSTGYETDYDIDQPERWSDRIFFNNLKFGNCITNDLKDIETSLQYEHREYQPISVVFHQRGTPPVFHNKNLFIVHPINETVVTNKFTVYVKKIVYEEKSWPFNSACVDPQTPIESFAILNHNVNESTRYNYSFESCLDRCLFKLTKSYCNCLLERSMTQTNDQLLPICPLHCNRIPKIKMDEMCNCKPLCSYAEISVVTDNGPNLNFKEKIYKIVESLIHGHVYKPNLSFNNLAETIQDEVFKSNPNPIYKILTIKQSIVTKTSNKHPLIKLEDVASTIGGIWGIWIGLSITVIFSFFVKRMPKIDIDYATEDEPTKTTSLENIIHLGGVIAIASLFFWQMHLLIHDYYQFNAIQVKSTEIQDSASFPSVYICSNGKIFINQEMLEGNVVLKDKINRLRNLTFLPREYIEFYQNQFSEEEKLLTSPSIEDFIKQCEIITDGRKSFPCKSREFKFIVNFTPTVCAIVDAINPTHSNIKEINLELKVPCSELFVGSEHFLTVSLDPLSMANVAEGNKLDQFHILPGDLVNIKYSLTEIRKLPAPYVSKCIEESTKYTIWPESIEKIGQSFNYSYNFKSCMILCLEKKRRQPINSEDFTGKEIQKSFDLIGRNMEELFDVTFDELSICQCRQPCRNKLYDIKTDQVFNVFKDSNLTDTRKILNFLWEGHSVVRIQKNSLQMTVLTEIPKTQVGPIAKPFSLVAAIGGISGIWIGQSLLNFFIELQLFFCKTLTKFMQYLKPLISYCRHLKIPLIRSSISAWNRVHSFKRKSRKFLWAFLLTFGSVFAIYHTLVIYLSRIDMNNASNKEINRKNYAVTFCLNNLKKCNDSIESFEKNFISSCDSTSPSLFFLSLLSEEDRFKTGKSIVDYLILPSPDQYLMLFNNLYYGSCGTFIFNHNIRAEFWFHLEFWDGVEAAPILVVHEEGAPPVFTPQNIISLTAEEIRIKVISKSIDQKYSRFFGESCVNTPRTIRSWASFKSPEKYFYKYSQQACLNQCLHELAKKYCQCILPKSMIHSNTEQLPICLRCNDIPKGELNSLCDCKPSCEMVEFQAIQKYLKPDTFFKMSVKTPIKGVINIIKDIFIDSQLIVTERLIKESSIKLESLLSAVGGVWNMWVGFSLSVVFSIAIAFCFKNLNNSNSKLILFLQNVIFLSAILLFAAMFIVQVYSTIEEYYQFKVTEVVSTEIQMSTDFPTVYVCYPDNTFNCGKQRYSSVAGGLPEVGKYIVGCEFHSQTGNKHSCGMKSIRFRTYYDNVNCAIVQPIDLNDKNVRITDLQLELKFPILPVMADATKLLVTFNPFATLSVNFIQLPVDQIYVSPGDSVDVQFSLTENRRLPNPYRSKCMIELSNNYTVWPDRIKNFVHHINYVYNFEDCLYFCSQATINMEECKCRLPCRDLQYKFDIVQQENKTIKDFMKRFNMDSWGDKIYIRTLNASVRIRQPPLKKVITEKPVLHLISLSSHLGGISMFWMGIPILALAIKFTIIFLNLTFY